MDPKNYIIKFENVSVGYQQKKQQHRILNNINLNIGQGKLIGIIGLNGSGKSTLLRTLAKQQKALSGNISILNKSIEKYNINEWAKTVSWVHTENAIPNNLRVKDLIALGRQPYTNWLDKLNNKDLVKIEEALNLTNLTNLKDIKCTNLSDGQLQKSFIARAICQDTSIILLDEPTTHLDIINKVETLNLLKTLCHEFNKTIIFSTHEIELSIEICDEVIITNNNKANSLTIKSLINSNSINSIFMTKNLHFDNDIKKFRLQNKSEP